jgi:DNA-binding NtrC family response regulator
VDKQAAGGSRPQVKGSGKGRESRAAGWGFRSEQAAARWEDDPLAVRPDQVLQILEEVIGRSLAEQTPSLSPLASRMAVAALHDVTVLITGETGVGKTYLARFLHDHSPRRRAPFLVVSCGALAVNLIESELFGHVRGAFTGAVQAKPGKFTAAGRGTILLDEVDTLSLEQQVKLLRILETGEYEPVGSSQTRKCQARIIAATNRDLDGAVQLGQFRPDLFYRLNVLPFHLPPLRERPEDVGCLVRRLVERFQAQFHKVIERVSPAALRVLQEQPWPGNIRHLENVVQLAVLTCPGPELLPEHLPPSVIAVDTGLKSHG